MTPEERWSIQKGIPYKKIYDNPIDNFIQARQKIKAKNDEILRKQAEKLELEKQQKELEKQIEKQVEKAIEEALKNLF